jgi:DNA-binding SARP family transcriptional activator
MLELRLLGAPRVLLNGKDLTADVGSKSLALLAYLALAYPPLVPRDKLAGTFWPDKANEQSRYRLRHSLWELGRVLGKNYLLSNEGKAWLNPDAPIQIDAVEFRRVAHELGIGATNFFPTQDQIPALTSLCALYDGEFLHDLTVRESSLFEEWSLVERERFQLLFLDILWSLAQAQQSIQDYRGAAETLSRLIEADPLRERNYRALMMAYHYLDDKSAALRIHKKCSTVLAAELGLAPSPETEQLRVLISQGTLGSVKGELERAEVLIQEKKLEEAEQVCAALDARADDPYTISQVALLRAEIALEQGRATKSLDFVRAARQAFARFFTS